MQDGSAGRAPAERAQVFERFDRGAGHAAANGSGLGLAIMRQAVLRMGGEVRLGEAFGGRGIGFFVRIPLPAEMIDRLKDRLAGTKSPLL